MKKWYKNLKNKLIVHVILIALNVISFFTIGFSGENSNVDLFIWLWLLSGVLEVVFLIFEIQLRMKSKNKKGRSEFYETLKGFTNYDNIRVFTCGIA